MKRRPAIGLCVMRRYGRVNYAEYGEIGTVTAHNDNGTFQMTLDAFQPYYREMWGSRSKPNQCAGLVHETLIPGEVEPLASVYRENARRFREIAKAFSEAAKKVEAGVNDE